MTSLINQIHNSCSGERRGGWGRRKDRTISIFLGRTVECVFVFDKHAVYVLDQHPNRTAIMDKVLV